MEIWFAIAKIGSDGVDLTAKAERSACRCVECLTLSTSYLDCASGMERGSPDQRTSAGLIGGMKRVRVPVESE